MNDNNLSIGCAGAGTLSSAIVGWLVECGFPVSVWNRDRKKIAPLAELGATPVDTPSEQIDSRIRHNGSGAPDQFGQSFTDRPTQAPPSTSSRRIPGRAS